MSFLESGHYYSGTGSAHAVNALKQLKNEHYGNRHGVTNSTNICSVDYKDLPSIGQLCKPSTMFDIIR